MLNKIAPFFAFLFLSFSVAYASQYQLNESKVEDMFTNSTEIQINMQDVAGILQKTQLKNGSKDRMTAGILGVIPCTGALGIHRYYLGHTTAGIVHTAIAVCGFGFVFIPVIGWIITGPIQTLNVISAIVDGIMYLVADDNEFQSKYANNKKIIQWF